MGYGVSAYRVSLKALSSTFKNPDKKIRDEAIEAGMSLHNGQIEIVKELVEEGKATNSKLAHKYLYAIEGIISNIGVWLPSTFWSPVGIDEYYELVYLFRSLGEFLPFRIPFPDDFPAVCVLPRAMMTKELSTTIKSKLDDDDLFNELQEWIDEAIRNNQDIIFYLY